MLIVAELLVLAFWAALRAPDTRIGRLLRALLIDTPTQAFRRVTPIKMIVGVIVFLGLGAIMIGAPEFFAIMSLGDLSLYLDITVITLLLSAALRVKSALSHAIPLGRNIAARIITRRNRARARSRVSRPRRLLPLDDEPDWAYA
jgi:hypothetical protein